ncbi:proteinaceous RNase P 2-like isoform X2 [Coffea eugenioides]|uniref:proteinaceous RNase P 2-like isoform X2 n=1 Tax=Coffea eugenioides TaxID=49369 RepID=UPI000F613A89|nr:proteinaceous RNase P 2-like isoform X2 [Coffea eugenioides]
MNTSNTATNVRNKKRKNLTPEIQFRLNLDHCSKSKDLSTAISLFDSVPTTGSEIHLTHHHYNSLLYICSNSVNSDHPSTKSSAIEFGFRVYHHMIANHVSPSEATVTAVARLAAAKADGDAAFELARSVGNQGKLRTYAPALLCFCRNGMADKASEVEEHMGSLGLRLEEPELSALLKVNVEKGKGDKVYEYLHKLRASVREVNESTANILESWFCGEVASDVGLEIQNVDHVNQVKLRNGDGWHGLGWLGKGKWVVHRSNVASDGRCCTCGEQLTCVDIDTTETERFAQSVASLAMEREVQSNFKEFQDWIEECSDYEAIVDGANVGLYQQNFAEGGFSIPQLDAVVRELYSRSKKWPLIILHKKRIRQLLEKASNRDLLQDWIDQGLLYGTPYGSNDDWYWLYAAVKLKCLLVTNDEMRDHTFELLGNSFFLRWKERHQVKYTFVKGNLKLLMPPTYSLVIQESEKGSWHVPVAGETIDESLRTWLCITRSGSCDALASSLNDDNQLSNSNKLETLANRNNSVGHSDDKLTSITGKRKERSSSSPEV